MNINLAPMEGVVDPIIRDIYSRLGGYDHMVTEFVRVSHRVVPENVIKRYCPELNNGGRTKSGTPVYVQFLGGDPTIIAESALNAQKAGALGVDLNFGCPAKTVNKHDGGASLLKKPQRLFDVISKVKEYVEIPVTAKVRLGFDTKEYVNDIAQAVDEAGAETLTVHARTKVEGYKPPAHWEFIAQMKDIVKKTPIYANGDIWSVEDFRRCYKITGCENIALGRPAIACPDLALQIKADFHQTPYNPITPQHILREFIPDFIEQGIHWKQPKFALSRFKQWSKLLGREYPEFSKLFESAKKSKELDELISFLTNEYDLKLDYIQDLIDQLSTEKS